MVKKTQPNGKKRHVTPIYALPSEKKGLLSFIERAENFDKLLFPYQFSFNHHILSVKPSN